MVLVNGALAELIHAENFEQSEDGLTPEETAQYFLDMWLDYLGEVETLLGAVIPMVVDVLPANMVWCEGQTLQRADYPDLYGRMHAAFIIDADSFTVPDLRAKFIFGSDETDGGGFPVGDTGGAVAVTLSVAEMPSHSHIYEYPSFNLDLESPGAPDILGLGSPGTDYPTSTEGDGNQHENLPPYLALRFAMVAKSRDCC